MLRIVILLKPAAIRKCCVNKRQKGILKNTFDIEFLIHDSCKNQNIRCTPIGNATPHMNLIWVFRLGFQFGRHSFLAEADPSMALNPNAGFISKYDVVEGFANFKATLTEGQASHMIWLPHYLIVFGAMLFLQPSFQRAAFTTATDGVLPNSIWSNL